MRSNFKLNLTSRVKVGSQDSRQPNFDFKKRIFVLLDESCTRLSSTLCGHVANLSQTLNFNRTVESHADEPASLESSLGRLASLNASTDNRLSAAAGIHPPFAQSPFALLLHVCLLLYCSYIAATDAAFSAPARMHSSPTRRSVALWPRQQAAIAEHVHASHSKPPRR